MPDYRLILASASPRRQQMLESLGLSFSVCPANIDEALLGHELAEEYVLRVAYDKAKAVAQGLTYDFILSSDTAVVIDGNILGKPKDIDDAVSMLNLLSGRVHQVLTSVVLHGKTETKHCLIKTNVEFACLKHTDILAYCHTDEPYDKAGAYGIQGQAARFVRRIDGSYSAVVGLPLLETTELLEQVGIKSHFTGR